MTCLSKKCATNSCKNSRRSTVKTSHSCSKLLRQRIKQSEQVCHRQLQERQKKHGEDISKLQQATQATQQTVREYVLEGGKELNLENCHLGPLQLDALGYILPKTDITSLILNYCGLTMKAAGNVLTSIGHLSQLTQLRLFGNNDLHGPVVMTAFSDSFLKLTKLEELSMGRCQLDDKDVSQLSSAMPELQQNCISDVGALNVTQIAVTLPCLKELWLCSNWLTEEGMEGVRQVARHTPRLWLVGLDMQRLPEHEARHPDDVVFWEHIVNQLQLAVSRVRRRYILMRDSRWDDDVAGLETWLEKTREELRQAHLRQSQQ
ncbi:hypothetical protein LSAT2_004417 [Lamellibrachia satsuma]|nr:hypothetical protein LSAT2_004417 [Lamellibrachia satsuma]